MTRAYSMLFFIVLLPVWSFAQPTATDLSYFPLHIGNVLTYKMSLDQGQGPVFQDYKTIEVTGDTLMPNGQRYYIWDGIPVRIDSLDGRVYQRHTSAHGGGSCPDSLDWEFFNLAIIETDGYHRCQSELESWTMTSTNTEQQVALLDISRYQREWTEEMLYPTMSFAEGIGLCAKYSITGVQWELVHAVINTVTYWPVHFRMFDAVALPGNSVQLRWSTENEIQNMGFAVHRRVFASSSEAWKDIAFVPSHVPEGHGGEYEFTDHTASGFAGRRLEYRLRQQDYDGSITYSPYMLVVLDAAGDITPVTAWPNPATRRMNIHANPRSESATLIITDMLGRVLRRYDVATGSAVLEWDLTDSSGIRVAAGVYMLTLLSSTTRVCSLAVVR